jgi:hypothetical protein
VVILDEQVAAEQVEPARLRHTWSATRPTDGASGSSDGL